MRKWQIRKFLNLFVLIFTLMSCVCHLEKRNKRSTHRWPLHLNYISTHFIFIFKIPISSLNSFIKTTSFHSSPFFIFFIPFSIFFVPFFISTLLTSPGEGDTPGFYSISLAVQPLLWWGRETGSNKRFCYPKPFFSITNL